MTMWWVNDYAQPGKKFRNLNGSNINLADQPKIVDALLHNAELPELDREKYDKSLEVARQAALTPVQEKYTEEGAEDSPDEYGKDKDQE